MKKIGRVVRKNFDIFVSFENRLRKIYLGPWEDLYLVYKGKKYDVEIVGEDVFLTGVTY